MVKVTDFDPSAYLDSEETIAVCVNENSDERQHPSVCAIHE